MPPGRIRAINGIFMGSWPMDERLKTFKAFLRTLVRMVFPLNPWFVALFPRVEQNRFFEVFLSFPFKENFLTEKMTSLLLPKLPQKIEEPVYREGLRPNFSMTTLNISHDMTVPIACDGQRIGLFWIGTHDWRGFLPDQRKTVMHLAALMGFMFGIYTQLTQRERDVFDSEFRFRDLVRHLEEAIFVSERDRFIYVNPSLSALLSVSEAELVGTSLFQWVHPDDLEAFQLRYQRFMGGETFPKDYEIRLRDRGGEIRQCLLAIKRLPPSEGNLLFGVLKDVTDLKMIWERLYEAKRKEAVGTLAGGIAHDFNNILGSILGYVSLIKGELSPNEKIYSFVEGIEQSSERAVKLIQQLLGFSSRGRYKEIPFVLQGTLQDLKEVITKMFDPSIKVVFELVREPLMILGDMDQVFQVLLNICLNARDAMPQGGVLKIGMKKKMITARRNLMKQTLLPGVYAQISIQDTGCGMDEAVLGKIFDPFFTTKEVGAGVGLGLSMAYGIVKSHGGGIEVVSTPGLGSVFNVYFPLYDRIRETVAMEDFPVTFAGKGEKILVVDDDENVRELVKEFLERSGYQVTAVRNGLEALNVYKSEFFHPFDLVLLDFMMPVMGGEEAFWELKRLNPNVKVILMTGFSADGDVRDLLQSGVLGYLQKPFGENALLRAVRTTLDL